jgi:hypothetical protein
VGRGAFVRARTCIQCLSFFFSFFPYDGTNYGLWGWEQKLERCCALDDTLGRLARLHPQTKFLRSRAGALGFATVALPRSRRSVPGGYESDDEGEDEDEEDKALRGEGRGVDTEMLPTLLVYRDGNLVYNWVRVDWEAGRAGVEELLTK